MDRPERVDLRRILADPDLRRKLMVSTLRATQAREGIETSEEQAEKAYYVITEAERAAFFDLAKFRGVKNEPDRREETFARALRGTTEGVRHDVARRDFAAIEGSPLAYQRVGLLAHLFRELPALEPAWGIARQGKATGDDDQWLRYWWEVLPSSGWVPFAKGGDFARFYADIYLVIDWKPERRATLKASGNGLPSEEYYFRPGLTWPRAGTDLSFRKMPAGCVFADKGPVVLTDSQEVEDYLVAVLNSTLATALGKVFVSREEIGGRWEVGIVKKIPIPTPSSADRCSLESLASKLHGEKALWDSGNQVSTHFTLPWIHPDRIGAFLTLGSALDGLLVRERELNTRLEEVYAELNREVYRLYKIAPVQRAKIEGTLGPRPPELVWPQREGASTEQKRMEHVWRLLDYVVKVVVEGDSDGIVPLASTAGRFALLDRVRGELERLYPDRLVDQVESEICNELKKKVKGYTRAESLSEWLENVFFGHHADLYKQRPIHWHLSSRPGKAKAAFGALVHYHRFDSDALAKLRSVYVRATAERLKREAAIATKEGREEDRIGLSDQLDEVQDFDRRLAAVQEGRCEGEEGGDRDYRIHVPWKRPPVKAGGWRFDIDDGVVVNLLPFQKAGLLRVAKVIAG